MLKSVLLLFLLLTAPLWAAPSLDDVELVALRPNVYLHRSYMKTDDFGTVDCNGLVYVVKGEALVVDTPSTQAQSETLIAKIRTELKAKVTGLVVGHTHADSMGGLEAFQKAGIASYSSIATQRRAAELKLPIPSVGYETALEILVGGRVVRCGYFGPGHAVDTSVTYLAAERVLFGGCLVKAAGAGRGFVGDADLGQWSATVTKVQQAFPEADLVVPGHGSCGDRGLLDFTITMFADDAAKSR